MRVDDLRIRNLKTSEQLEEVKKTISGITGAIFVGADLDQQVVEFGLQEDLDDLTLTDVQCALRDKGFDAGEAVEGQTCVVRFKKQ